MWQFAMNFPGNGDRRTGFGAGNGETRRGSRLPALACFTAIAALHIVFISVFDLLRKSEKPFTETRELFLTLEAADNSPEESAEAAQELPFPAVPLPEEEVPSFEPLPEEISLPLEESGITSPAEETGVAAAPATASFPASAEAAPVKAGNTGAPADSPEGFAPPRSMTDAEYLALIMDRLEKNKVYPLSVRKRGIEGDITAAFTIRRDGTISDLRLADPSGHRFLAQAAFETIRSASPFPVMEGRDGNYTVQVSIRYRLEDEDPRTGSYANPKN
ncbi:MAG: energy transducer TonB [Treponema sp.]|jgi:TonB family protein|nr:energy transducer TonB [Treponema sp.]